MTIKMPFKSKKQESLCYYLKSKNPNLKWDCKKWSKMTNHRNLPQRVSGGKTKRKRKVSHSK